MIVKSIILRGLVVCFAAFAMSAAASAATVHIAGPTEVFVDPGVTVPVEFEIFVDTTSILDADVFDYSLGVSGGGAVFDYVSTENATDARAALSTYIFPGDGDGAFASQDFVEAGPHTIYASDLSGSGNGYNATGKSLGVFVISVTGGVGSGAHVIFGRGNSDVPGFDGGLLGVSGEDGFAVPDFGFNVLAPPTLTWDGTDGQWTGAHWGPGPGAPGGHEHMVVDSGTAVVSADLTATPAASLAIASGAAGGTVRIGASGVLRVTGDVSVGVGGTLSVDGVLAAPVVNVAGGTLTSSTGGAGVATVQGSVVLAGGATLAVDATDTGLDRLACTGSVTIDPSASLAIAPPAPDGPAIGLTVPLITAGGGLTGIFGHVDGVLLGADRAFAVTYQPNGATVTVVTPGDIEVDGDVDFSDFTYLAASYGQSGKSWVDGDCDGDGTVGFSDFTHLAAHYGSDIDSAAAGQADAPPAGTVELHVDVTTGQMWLVGNAATLSGYSITSAAGSLVPDGDGSAAPFQFYLSDLGGDVSAAGLGAGVLVDGELALDAGYDTSGPMDLAFSYGVFGQGGSVSGQIVTVPEPTCLALLALGGPAMLRRRRRR